MALLKGHKAIEYKKNHPNVELNKFCDPTEEERYDISVEYAMDVAGEDPGLIWLDNEIECVND